uniref:ZP domain-containing protein n=1 Tax=Caenorhabditis tropicalis TaxID=1561998 RepID=A0A1I7TZV0_9PELO
MRPMLVLSLLIGVASSRFFMDRAPTSFFANGTLSCQLKKPWCFNVQMYEDDFSFEFANDVVASYGTRCTRFENHQYELTGNQFGDGLWNDDYEINISITHNCTISGKKRRFRRVPQIVAVETP